MEKTFTEKELKNFVIKLRKKQRELEEKVFFCEDHNFKLEALSKRNQVDVIRKIIYDMEQEFKLGFVWDNSLD